MGDELGESRSPGGRIRGIPEEAGILVRKVPFARKVLPARKARVRGRTCQRGKGVLRGRDCRPCGHSLAGIGIWTMITVINCTAWVLRRRDNILRGFASKCTQPFSGTDC